MGGTWRVLATALRCGRFFPASCCPCLSRPVHVCSTASCPGPGSPGRRGGPRRRPGPARREPRAHPGALQPGIRFAYQTLLRIAIVLLGARFAFDQVLAIGGRALVLIVTLMALALLVAHTLAHVAGVPRRLASLIGVGTAVCGNSAITAVAPVIGARDEEMSYAIATNTVFGTAAVFAYPLLGHALGLDDAFFGTWAGTAVNDTSQVVATGFAYSDAAGELATTVKLTRNALMGLVIMGMGLAYGAGLRSANMPCALGSRAPSRSSCWVSSPWRCSTPWACSSTSLPGRVATWSESWAGRPGPSSWSPLAGVGLATRVTDLRRVGWRPFAVGLATACAVALASYGLIAWLGPRGPSDSGEPAASPPLRRPSRPRGRLFPPRGGAESRPLGDCANVHGSLQSRRHAGARLRRRPRHRCDSRGRGRPARPRLRAGRRNPSRRARASVPPRRGPAWLGACAGMRGATPRACPSNSRVSSPSPCPSCSSPAWRATTRRCWPRPSPRRARWRPSPRGGVRRRAGRARGSTRLRRCRPRRKRIRRARRFRLHVPDPADGPRPACAALVGRRAHGGRTRLPRPTERRPRRPARRRVVAARTRLRSTTRRAGRSAAYDGSETILVGAERAPFRLSRLHDRTGLDALDYPGAGDESPEAGLAALRARWEELGPCPRRLRPLGQGVAHASALAAACTTTGAMLQAFRQRIGHARTEAPRLGALAANSPLAVAHGTRYPIVQGPMTRVSDRAPFIARVVAENGALPFLALALMRKERRVGPCSRRRGRDSASCRGASGVLGFVPPELREEQLAAIREVRPRFGDHRRRPSGPGGRSSRRRASRPTCTCPRRAC